MKVAKRARARALACRGRSRGIRVTGSAGRPASSTAAKVRLCVCVRVCVRLCVCARACVRVYVCVCA